MVLGCLAVPRWILEDAKKMERHKRVVETRVKQAVLKMTHQGLSGAWGGWCEYHRLKQRKRNILLKVRAKMKYRCARPCTDVGTPATSEQFLGYARRSSSPCSARKLGFVTMICNC